ncbi:MAG: hypothetical protein OYH77_02660 [Pseudomonadota bacterium]|nr:hypothetical protein [Pseudomonadota bacterium]
MAYVNRKDKEIGLKFFYFGANRSGRSESLRSLFRHTSPQISSDLFMLEAEAYNPAFDFLPLSLKEPTVAGFRINVHLFTLPSECYRDTYDVVLQGLDGYVHVIDSSLDSLLANIDALRTTAALLDECGHAPEDAPQVFQYNKRDAEDAVALDILRSHCNPQRFPEHESIATRDIGTLECLHDLTRLVLAKMLNTATL